MEVRARLTAAQLLGAAQHGVGDGESAQADARLFAFLVRQQLADRAAGRERVHDAHRLTEVGERRITTEDLAGADEMFITSSTIEVVPVLRVDRRKIGSGRVGEVTQDLQRRYRRYVARRLGLNIGDLG